MAVSVKQMLEAARLEDARLELHVRPIELCDLVEEAVGSVVAATTDRHRLLEVSSMSQEPVQTAFELADVALHLLGNERHNL